MKMLYDKQQKKTLVQIQLKNLMIYILINRNLPNIPSEGAENLEEKTTEL